MELAVVKDENKINFEEICGDASVISPENQAIWENRIEFLKSRGIKVMMPFEACDTVLQELFKRNKWGFLFC